MDPELHDLLLAIRNAEQCADTLASDRLPSTSRTYREGWATYPGVEVVAATLRRYAEESSVAVTAAK